MIRVLVGAALIPALFLHAQPPFIVHEHLPIALAVVQQSRLRGPLSAEEIATELDAAFRAETGFSVELVSPELVRAELELPPQPPVDVLARVNRLAAKRVDAATDRALILLYAPNEDGSATLSCIYAMPHVSQAELEAYRASTPDWRGGADELLLSKGVPAACTSLMDSLVTPLEVRSAAALRDELRRLVTERLRSCLESEGAYRPFGRLAVELPSSGFELLVDGRAVGVAKGSSAVLEQVRVGEHTFTAVHPDFERWERSTTVEGASDAALRVDAADLRLARAAGPRRAARWSALGLGALGVAALAVGVAKGGSQQDASCLEFAPGSCSIQTYERLGGVPLLPLGLGLIGAGLVMGTGTYVEGPRRTPWASVALGLAAGAAVLAAGWAAE